MKDCSFASQIVHQMKVSVGNRELLERAFRLADSGDIRNLTELRKALIEDGLTITELQQFHGRALTRQLSARITGAIRQPRDAGIHASPNSRSITRTP